MIIKSNRGVTLVTLVITLIVLFILASVTIHYGTGTQENAQREAQIAKLQLMQEKVNVIYQKILNKNPNYIDSTGNIIIGKDISDIKDEELIEQIDTVLSTLNISDNTQYKYFDKTNIDQLDLGGLEDKILINFNIREIILLDGIEYKEYFYYRLEDITSVIYNVQYENKNTVAPEFSVITQYLANSCKIIVKDIVYSEQINLGEVSYKLQADSQWIKISGTEFEVDKPGIYDVKLTDSAGNETTKQAYVYVFRDLLLCLDASQNLRTGYSNTATVWEDLSINNNDMQLENFDGTATSGWQENYLCFDDINDRGNSINVIDYDKTKKLTIQFVDLNGRLYSNEDINIILESSENYSNNFNSFVLTLNEYGTKNLCFSTRNNMITDDTNTKYNYSYKDNTIKEISTQYTTVLNATREPEQYMDMYLNAQKQESLTRHLTGSIDYIENYKLYLGVRSADAASIAMDLANLKIYKTELTQDEININYQIDKARYNIQDNV